MALSSWSDSRVISQLDSGTKWGGLVISYSFPSTASGIATRDGEGAGFQPLNAKQQGAAELALFIWDDLIRPEFFKATGASNIEYGMSSTGVEYAHAYYPQTGSVWFNYTYRELAKPEIGDRGFETYVHETGHALGLDHMGDYNGAGDWNPSCYQDSTLYSVMSYFGPSERTGEGQVAWADWVGSDGTLYAPQTPMLNDILAIQSMYGAESSRTGDTVYGFNCSVSGNMGRVYDFTNNANPILCIYDSGGTDTLDLSGWDTTSEVSLVDGTFSSCNSMTSNISIARNCVIENATTGDGRDSLTGNTANNILSAGGGDDMLTGSGGDDLLIGGLGLDTALYSQSVSNYCIFYADNELSVSDQTANRDGTDQLQGIETVKFGHGTWQINQQSGTDTLDRLALKGAVADYLIQTNGQEAAVLDTVQSRDELKILDSIERLSFSNGVVALDVGFGQNAGSAYRLYQAAFDRTPDSEGIGYWIDLLDRGTDLVAIADGFMLSKEFRVMYGDQPSDQTFLTLLYNHVFDRNPDTAGYNYWQKILSSGVSRAAVLTYFSESDENIKNVLEMTNSGVAYNIWQQ